MASFRSDRGSRKPYSRPSRAPEGQWVHDKAPGVNVGAPRPSRPTVTTPSASASNAPTEKLLVSNLHYEITAKDLTAIFGQIGTLVREPLIRYDRSGRSSGQGFVSFETIAEAVRAKKQFNGILAKGQPMTVDFLAPRAPRGRSASVPNTLINRIQKPALLDRLARDDSSVKQAPSSGGVGPIRSRPVAGRAPRGAKKGPKKPPTAEELDKELDAFMGDSNTPAEGGAAASGTTETTAAVPDVEMA